MIPIPASIPIQFLLRHWRLIGGAVAAIALGLFLWAKVNAYGDRREAQGIALERAAWEDKEARATAAHEAKILEINEGYHAKHTDLETRLAAALRKPPAVRVVRLSDGSCPAAITVDAGQPAPADPAGGSTQESGASYRVLRDEFLRLGADAERMRQALLDARAGWPQ